MHAVATLRDPKRAELVLHPVRRRILEEAAAAPVSATEVGRRMGESRQKVNYHLRTLVDAELLEPAGSRPRRGLEEKLYRASARVYALAPEVLGDLSAPQRDRFADGFSAGTLLALASRTHAEVARAAEQADREGKRLATLSLDADVHFADAAGQAGFARELREAVTALVRRWGAEPAPGETHRYRVVAGVHPVPRDETASGAPPGRDPTPEPEIP